MDDQIRKQFQEEVGAPPAEAVSESRRRVAGWFEGAAPLIRWQVVDSPLGRLFIAASERGVCRVAFGITEQAFLDGLDPLARTVQDPDALAAAVQQLREYFERPLSGFDLPLDLSGVTPFQRRVLQEIRAIPAGSIWTYKQAAETLGRPRASRAVGQALARNPLPIIVPCHRVVGSGGALTGYTGSGGIRTKRWLLEWEGALPAGRSLA